MINQRPLTEIILNERKLKNTDKIINWCENNALFVHRDQTEYMFWIPPLEGHERYLKETYGEDIPFEIEQLLIKEIHSRNEMPDGGFLLIVISEIG
jgi:hypothetical protein